jgi:hypothetical protein
MRTPLLIALLLPACVDASDPPSRASEVGERLGVAITEATDEGITVELVNARDAAADVALNVDVVSSAGLEHAYGLEVLRLAPLERVAVTLPRDKVPAFIGAAQLSVSAEVSYGDGVRRSPSSKPVAIVADGTGWRGGDAEAVIVSARPERDAEVDGDITSPAEPTTNLVIAQRLCFRVLTQYEDAGHGEDFWTIPESEFRTLRGADVQVFYDGTSFTTTLGDGLDGSHAGCVEISGRGIKTDDFLTVKLWSSGRVNGHDVRVETESTGSRALASTTFAYKQEPDPDVWRDITPAVSAQDRFNIFMAAGYALYRHGGLQGASLTLLADATGGTRGGSKHIWVDKDHAHLKFVIAHEVGHYVAKNSDANFGNLPSVCKDAGSSWPAPCDANDHQVTSKELVLCAAVEGFGNFYAADVFNDHDGDDCFVMLRDTPVINCQGANDGFPLRMMETRCTGDLWAGYGNETDWMRVFWDVHTGGGADQPSLNDVLRWMEDADDDTDFTSKNVYDLLNAEAAQRGGRLRTNWDSVKDDHGIDHPID